MNTQTSLNKFKWFWAWDDEKEEAWLSAMAQQGWQLQAITGPGSYRFTAAEAQKTVYRMDYFYGGNKDYPNYLQLFADAGWEHIGVLGGWQYFRKPASAGQPEIYTDNASKTVKYQRVLLTLVLFLPIYLVMTSRLFDSHISTSRFAALYQAGGFCAALLLILYSYAILRLGLRILQLRRQ